MKDKKSVALAVLATLLFANMAFAQAVLVPSPFTTTYDGWESTFDGVWPTDPTAVSNWNPYDPLWGVLLGQDYMIENSNGAIGSLLDTGGNVIQDTFVGFNMINKTVPLANQPSEYMLTATFSRSDNDGLGLIFGYQDENNYFRISNRTQVTADGNHEEGIGIQKFVNGVCTEIVTPVSVSDPPRDTDFTIGVGVYQFLGTPCFDVSFDGTYVITGATDTDLQPGQYGIYSWAMAGDWGTSAKDVTLTSSTVNLTHTFTNDGPVDWKEYNMVNSIDESLDMLYQHPSNFRLNFTDGTIIQDANNLTWATSTTPNIDFLSPTVVVDDPNSNNWADYKMQVRMKNEDNDGIGLMVRVQDDNTFYRINFANQEMHEDILNPPQGMSIQKCVDGVWSELYRDNQANPLFIYTPEKRDISDPTIITQESIPFDVTVTVVGNTITVQVIDDPDSANPTTINYPTVYDTDASYIEYGSVGFTAWGSGSSPPGGGSALLSTYSGYGGDMNAPLVVAVPEPSTIILLLMGIGMLVLRKVKR
ncbi:MAG: PEP-CTERM sorting domain-containing protein [Planctomycetia bacterium]